MAKAVDQSAIPRSLATNSTSMLVLSDDSVIRDTVVKRLPHATFLTYAGLMKASDTERLFKDVKVFWLDLPRGGRWRATKIRQLEKLYNTVLKDRNDISKFCILPAEHNWPSQFPRHRWQQVLTKWKPTSAPICHCCFEATGDAQTRHVQYRVYSSGLKIECETCTEPHEQGNKGQSKHFYSNFVNTYLTPEKVVYVSSSCVDRKAEQADESTASSSKGKTSRKTSNLRGHAPQVDRSSTRHSITEDCGPPPDSLRADSLRVNSLRAGQMDRQARTCDPIHSPDSSRAGGKPQVASTNVRTPDVLPLDSPDLLNSPTLLPDGTPNTPEAATDLSCSSFVASNTASDKTLEQIYEADWSPSLSGQTRTCEPRGAIDQCVTYPTESRERQKKKEKENKEKGIEKTKKKTTKVVEDHHDDCGECLDSITKDLDADYHVALDDRGNCYYDSHELSILDNIQFQYFYGIPGGHSSRLVNVTVSEPEQLFKILVEKP